MNGLGVLYAKAEGVPLNYAEAKRWYEKSAALGESWAMFNLGLLYEFGQGVSADRDEARRWYEKAAALGLAEANQRLATMPKSDIPDFRRQRVQ
jgi:TPR repeat protein